MTSAGGAGTARSMLAGTPLGAGVGFAAAIELVAAHRALANPFRVAADLAPAVLAYVLVGAFFGAFFGATGARFFSMLRGRSAHGASFFAVLGSAAAFWPHGLEAAGAGALLLVRLLRAAWFPRQTRLDRLASILVLGAAAAYLVDHLPPALPEPPLALSPEAGAPVPGSIPVTLTIHSTPDFPEVPAVHPGSRALDADSLGVAHAMWSGTAPSRSPVGARDPLRLFGGGTLAWSPSRPVADFLLGLVGRPLGTDDPRRTDRPLERLVRAAAIPVIHGAPSPEDPGLWLRIIETPHAPTPSDAASFRANGAWIDVRGAGDSLSIALSGEGTRLSPTDTRASAIDVAPTILHLLGLAVPRSMDGRVLLELLDPEGPGRRMPRYRDSWARADSASIVAR